MSWHEGPPTPPADFLGQVPDAPPPLGLNGLQDAYVGNPMYNVIAEHGPALVFLLAMAGVFLWLRRRESPMIHGYFQQSVVQRFLLWLLAITGVGHLALIFTHEPSFYSVLYLVGGLAPLWAIRRSLSGARWRRWTGIILLGLLGGYGVSMIAGEAPDQFGLALKLVEITALFIVVRPRGTTRRKRATTVAAMLLITLFTTATSWFGAFSSGDSGHHLGDTPPPGFMVPVGEDREPTPEESARAAAIVESTTAALHKYEDIDVAQEEGYDVAGMRGLSAHADNESLKNDDHIFDPAHPETLVYAIADSGAPVLLGAMYQMDDVGQRGPAIAGPLTVWHAHDHVCFSLLPLAIVGFTSPLGQCPLGSLTMPLSNEMLHIWTLPGLEDPFDDIDEEWLKAYLAER